MPLDIPIQAPLTESQAELTAKIGSMKSLLALPTAKKLNIPKGKQISLFDYILKVMRTLGIEPEFLFNLFLDKVFDEVGTFLEDKVIDALADSLGEQGKQLPSISNQNASDSQKKAFKESNKVFLKGLIPTTFLQAFKQKMAKDLTIMIFGPKDGPTATILNTSPPERERLINNAVCGQAVFSVSSPPIVREEELEFNRVALRQQLEKGEVELEISCQKVKIKLPEDPGFFFDGGGQNTVSNTAITPGQSLQFLVEHVKNQTQNINNEQNANSAGKSFEQTLIEKLLSFITTIVFPYLTGAFSVINSTSAGASSTPGNVVFSPCDIANDPDNKEVKEFQNSLSNALLKELLKIMLLFLIKRFKKFVANYFARTAIERQKRKTQKIRLKFNIFKAVDTLNKASAYASALLTLKGVLDELSE